MQSTQTPFSQQELLPQEEMLEISRTKSEMLIGLPKETSDGEKRICLTPDSVQALTANGHKVYVERNAGEYAGFSDRDYSEAGVTICSKKEDIFSCPIVLKVSPPSLDEIKMLNPQSILISALQLKMRKKSYFQKLAEKRATALAFEFIKDEHGGSPAVRALSEIAGTSSILIASEILSSAKFGNGLMFGNTSGVPPTEVVILGAGTVGEYAARASLGLGANVKVFDSSLTKLRCIQAQLNQQIYTSTLQPKNLIKALKRTDVLIGAVRGINRSPVLVTENMVKKMKKGAVIIDISIDMGGCVETTEITSHENPVVIKHDVIHYGVPNIPSRYARTSSVSISNMFTPYLLDIGEKGGLENTLRFDTGLRNGLYFYHGVLTSKSVANWFDLSYRDPNLLIF
ncbi:alanine dehydrogenase [Mesohalobacter halotolerans]|uniref:alanine dehydrogenase n=1 Tax=Mesohalobacter halotolerans TaxID=1883405 RepID=A0A4U5TR84_9FLAO|nr:alanine dehydrogenase [Mesohalobacter halotolerans]TKS56750.1 alanine dehydrogenase [Mesohalobacter halotolerans]